MPCEEGDLSAVLTTAIRCKPIYEDGYHETSEFCNYGDTVEIGKESNMYTGDRSGTLISRSKDTVRRAASVRATYGEMLSTSYHQPLSTGKTVTWANDV